MTGFDAGRRTAGIALPADGARPIDPGGPLAAAGLLFGPRGVRSSPWNGSGDEPPTRGPAMIDPNQVHPTLKRHQLVDGFPFVLDLERSHGVWLVDKVTGKEYLDCFTSFASWPIGYNHPKMADARFREELLAASLVNPANSDLYTQSMAEFVELFSTHLTPPEYPYHFWVSGGTLAVENALKTAFDWKARKLGRTQMTDAVEDLVILHFQQAFHGRSGYCLSLTNTVPDKTGLFPRFPWPRVSNPFLVYDLDGAIANDVEAAERKACAEIEAAFAKHGKKIAAIIIEPLQGEGGDNHFRPEFLKSLRRYADENDALLVFDEVQTGFYGAGKPWLWQILGVAPDIVAFGKKSQVCGIYANRRLDEVQDHVFKRPSRINSTWGGNLADMVRARRFIEIIESERLAENVAARGRQIVERLRELARERGGFTNVRGRGSLVAFTLQDAQGRAALLASMRQQGLLALASGTSSVRLRMPLVISAAEIEEVVAKIAAALPAPARA
jgi:L-lysine 6-transaminase